MLELEAHLSGGGQGRGEEDRVVAGGVVAQSFQAVVGGLEVSRVAGGFAGFALSGAADRTVGHIGTPIYSSSKKRAASEGELGRT
jgi:hypothetical protein